MATEQPPAGWYPDSERPGQQRYWDGSSWTEHRIIAEGTRDPTPQRTKKKRRVFLWAFSIIQILFIIWIIAGAASGSGTPTNCGSLSTQDCNAAQNVGTGIGVVLIIILWMVVDFFLAVGYLIYRLARRP